MDDINGVVKIEDGNSSISTFFNATLLMTMVEATKVNKKFSSKSMLDRTEQRILIKQRHWSQRRI